MSPGYPFNIWSKFQRSRSQGHKVQKHISGDRVHGRREFALYRMLSILLFNASYLKIPNFCLIPKIHPNENFWLRRCYFLFYCF